MSVYDVSPTRVSILEPCASNVGVLLVNDMLDIFEILLKLVRVENACDAGTNRNNSNFAGVRSSKNYVYNEFLRSVI